MTIRNGERLRSLVKKSFKKSHVWWVTSRKHSNQLWSRELPRSCKAVKAWQVRDKTDYPEQKWLDHGDVFDYFLDEWLAERLKQSPCLPSRVGATGAIYPSMEDVEDRWRYIRSARVPTRPKPPLPLLPPHLIVQLPHQAVNVTHTRHSSRQESKIWMGLVQTSMKHSRVELTWRSSPLARRRSSSMKHSMLELPPSAKPRLW